MPSKTVTTDEATGAKRCWWCGSDTLYQEYHDTEWGFAHLPDTDDDVRLFEKICLEGFQAGLSWITILRKRANFRSAFHGFNIERVARMTKRDVNRLVQDVGIVRHRGKIESTVNNARRALETIDEHGSLAVYFWQFEPDRALIHRSSRTIPAQTDESRALSRDLRRRGWSFVGPTTMYAFMQSVGIVNDHLAMCSSYEPAARARKAFYKRLSGSRR